MAKVVTLNAETHTYTDQDGNVVRPSATELLKWAGHINDTHYDAYGAHRGSMVHLACQLHNEGDLNEDTIDPVIMPYYQAYVRFLFDTGFKVLRGEFIAYNEALGIVCKPDIEGYWPGTKTKCLIDLKSGKLMPWTGLQLAFQRLAIGEPRLRYGLELKKNGKYKLHPFVDRSDETVILHDLSRYRQMEKGEGL